MQSRGNAGQPQGPSQPKPKAKKKQTIEDINEIKKDLVKPFRTLHSTYDPFQQIHGFGDGSVYFAEDACGFDQIVIDEYCDAFRLSDEFGDGFVNYKDLPVIMIRVGAFPRYSLPELGEIDRGTASTPWVFKRLEHCVNGIDEEGTNMYDFQFFLKLMRKWDENGHKYLGQDELLNAFRILDLDNSGFITSNEVRQIMNVFGDKLSLEEADGMLELADLDGNGNINYEEFVGIVVQQIVKKGKPRQDSSVSGNTSRPHSRLSGAGGGGLGATSIPAGI
ncbi:unnamed protein product [Amoebophrya sp. A120]|nr:unnamed protein product [Amoebophrya sp. A120]|eukprot:GSA120T00022335001.1